MALKVTFNIRQTQREMDQFAQEIEDDVIESMQQAGEDFVTSAREMKRSEGSFGDVTGNLRSSIGYVIRKDGEIILDNFEGTSEGVASARRAIEEIPETNGLQLIGVAGMDYATHVESRGLNVITVQGEAMLIDLRDYMKAIERKYNRK